MDFGMPTLIEIHTLEETADLCSKLNLNFIELNMNLPQYQLNSLNMESLKQIALKYNIYYTIHLEEELEICSFNDDIRKAWIGSVIATIKMAKKLNIKVLNMHLSKGVHFTLPTEKVYLYEKYEEIYLDRTRNFRGKCDEELKNTDIIISIENTDGYLKFQKKAIEELLNSNHFALTWDVGHSHSFYEDDEEYIKKHCNRLIHMHLHDAIGNKTHLEFGTGEVDIKEKIKIASKHKCRCVIEVKTIESLVNSVKQLNSFRRNHKGL